MSTFFQIDLEVIKTMRSKDFSLGFAENISEFMIFGRNIGKVKSFYKFCKVDLNVQKAKTKFKIARVQKF